MRCCTVLQDSATLYWDTPLGLGPFRVVAASYGHPRDPKLAIDVRPQLQTRVVSSRSSRHSTSYYVLLCSQPVTILMRGTVGYMPAKLRCCYDGELCSLHV